MKAEHWVGACHATSSVLFVALSELGYNPILCIGEVRYKEILFDHSWIELDGKIIDLALSMALKDVDVSAPIVLDKDLSTLQKYEGQYGVTDGNGLDFEANSIMKNSFLDYMNGFPGLKNGLWDVVNIILDGKQNIDKLRIKYESVERNYINKKIY
ncbi:lasso peptide biosynthesis protein [Clostridium sp. IBUN13A]|nr:lasso peptide biosynthesis protein [Clostridium sp. IBUN13A]